MDCKIIWSPEALEDIEAIAEYIARDSEHYARAVVSKILELTGSMAEFPFIGRIVPEIGNEHIRERFVYSYRLVYRIRKNEILIIAVIHGKRLLDNIFDRIEQ